ncbi:hypothetical protein PUNSTDRAFT_138891 [Punctularia strigosozonata HHB-11173 SS5]|uniref:Uncharacterized protein n=1 Tax=Punctularia strigosozonata (strain HHB-11173) TaxID=741275 RepID=R7S4J4_PUNST|nr:uncharacterized protein PUNSTDRAFT_138891 [Punctularia strigosozonata HHB-11173 SS5]EIN04166.1 hypothetical protein PUNSTDRAFT_138891 [Punctularia strigosozonata HHB-11173 SS5]
MEESLSHALASAQCLLNDVEKLDAQRVESRARRIGLEHEHVNPSPPIGAEIQVTSRSSKQPQREPTKERRSQDVRTLISVLRRLQSGGDHSARPDYSDEELRTVYVLFDDFRNNNSKCHDCRRSEDHQQRVNREIFLKPRPRVGVDVQGIPFHDWSACPPEARLQPRMTAEICLMSQTGLLMQGNVDTDVLVFPAALRPRPSRVFSQQIKFQLQHIPESIYGVLQRWHLRSGRCFDCLVKAMQTFPPWIMEQRRTQGYEEGNPVFVNHLDNELAEWDEDRRRWRLRILDHYRWLDVEELDPRSNDSMANPEIVNGTEAMPIPFETWSF